MLRKSADLVMQPYVQIFNNLEYLFDKKAESNPLSGLYFVPRMIKCLFTVTRQRLEIGNFFLQG